MALAQGSGPAAAATRLPAGPRWWNEETRFGWLAISPALAFFAFFVGKCILAQPIDEAQFGFKIMVVVVG
jgi:hypothetical protein